MDNYQGKNLDRYQEEIRKAAAKGVKDLNLNGNITPTLSHGCHVGRTLPKSTGSTSYATSNGNLATRTPNPIVSSVSSSVQSGISVSAAAAKFESLQRLNQINASNINASKTQAETLFQNEATQKDNTGRRKSTGPILATMIPMTRESATNHFSNNFISKSNSASSVLQPLTNGHTVLQSTNTMPGTSSSGGVIADFAFGNGGSVQSNNTNNNTSGNSTRMSPSIMEHSHVDQNPMPVHQLAARFNQALNTNTKSPSQCEAQKVLGTNNSTQSSRQSSVSPFPSRVSPSPNIMSLNNGPTGIALSGISTNNSDMILTSHNLSNGMSIMNHNTREQSNMGMVSSINISIYGPLVRIYGHIKFEKLFLISFPYL